MLKLQEGGGSSGPGGADRHATPPSPSHLNNLHTGTRGLVGTLDLVLSLKSNVTADRRMRPQLATLQPNICLDGCLTVNTNPRLLEEKTDPSEAKPVTQPSRCTNFRCGIQRKKLRDGCRCSSYVSLSSSKLTLFLMNFRALLSLETFSSSMARLS